MKRRKLPGSRAELLKRVVAALVLAAAVVLAAWHLLHR
jgi:hypothetical protein